MQLDLMDWLPRQETTNGNLPKLRLVSNRRSARRPKTPESALAQLELLFQVWDEETIVWSVEDIATLREALLRDALQTILDGRASATTRDELWHWMSSDELEPFSFRACCQAVEVHWEEMRETFFNLAKRHGKQNASTKRVAS